MAVLIGTEKSSMQERRQRIADSCKNKLQKQNKKKPTCYAKVLL